MKVVAASASVAAALGFASVFFTPATATLCSDPEFDDFYTLLLAQANACETATGVNLDATLTDLQVETICAECLWLAETTANKTFPDCTVKADEGTSLINVQTQYDRLFACSPGVASSSGSAAAVATGSDASGMSVTTATPTAATAATAAPASQDEPTSQGKSCCV